MKIYRIYLFFMEIIIFSLILPLTENFVQIALMLKFFIFEWSFFISTIVSSTLRVGTYLQNFQVLNKYHEHFAKRWIASFVKAFVFCVMANGIYTSVTRWVVGNTFAPRNSRMKKHRTIVHTNSIVLIYIYVSTTWVLERKERKQNWYTITFHFGKHNNACAQEADGAW
jgi:hypothetical protein